MSITLNVSSNPQAQELENNNHVLAEISYFHIYLLSVVKNKFPYTAKLKNLYKISKNPLMPRNVQ